MRASRKIILLLFVVLVAVVGFSFFSPKQKKQTAISPQPTVLPSFTPTGTFTDNLIGDFVYYKDGAFFDSSFPSRQSVQLLGVSDKVIQTFPAVRPAWNSDGSLFAFIFDARTIVLNNFTQGTLAIRMALDSPIDLSKNVTLSFSPDDTLVLVKEQTDAGRLRFFDATSGKVLFEKTGCEMNGVWIRSLSVYATTCTEDGKNGIVLIDATNSKTPLTVVGSAGLYTFLNVYDSSSLLVKRDAIPGKLTYAGIFTPLSKSIANKVESVDALANPMHALAAAIQVKYKTETIDDLVVAPVNTYAIFHTQKGLWAIPLPLSTAPVFLFEGNLPSIRPL